ncbi:hypothetical protein LIER_05650 [Lithospermum erythrorhizon]|uniref:FHA domain-containing protein n=1 Tax=Lithospermum erythrorhizon TaxID=34254 RepID=A0AAV3P193_LITER
MDSSSSNESDVEAGFAKLQGSDFEYYMQTYSILLGRNSKNSTQVDVDLSSLGGGMNISRNHARIFYDFQRRVFALEVLGRNGCYVEGVHYLPGTLPVKLDSQDLVQIGDKEFYFTLPVRSFLGGNVGMRQHVDNASYGDDGLNNNHQGLAQFSSPVGGGVGCEGRGGGLVRGRGEYDDEDDDDDDDDDDAPAMSLKKARRVDGVEGRGSGGRGSSSSHSG